MSHTYGGGSGQGGSSGIFAKLSYWISQRHCGKRDRGRAKESKWRGYADGTSNPNGGYLGVVLGIETVVVGLNDAFKIEVTCPALSRWS